MGIWRVIRHAPGRPRIWLIGCIPRLIEVAYLLCNTWYEQELEEKLELEERAAPADHTFLCPCVQMKQSDEEVLTNPGILEVLVLDTHISKFSIIAAKGREGKNVTLSYLPVRDA
eukprot:1148182-Pelagomonas_calceolata.AAC.1